MARTDTIRIRLWVLYTYGAPEGTWKLLRGTFWRTLTGMKFRSCVWGILFKCLSLSSAYWSRLNLKGIGMHQFAACQLPLHLKEEEGYEHILRCRVLCKKTLFLQVEADSLWNKCDFFWNFPSELLSTHVVLNILREKTLCRFYSLFNS